MPWVGSVRQGKKYWKNKGEKCIIVPVMKAYIEQTSVKHRYNACIFRIVSRDGISFDARRFFGYRYIKQYLQPQYLFHFPPITS